MKAAWLIAALLPAALLLCSCTLLPPTPDRDQILRAVTDSNNAQEEPLDLVYEEMQVPHRYPGRAGAVVWVADQSIQRNFNIVYDKKEKTFYVESYITLRLGEDGTYRNSGILTTNRENPLLILCPVQVLSPG